MSLSIDLHLDQDKMVSLEAWRAVVSRKKYPLDFTEEFDPYGAPGCLTCTYNKAPTTIEYYFNDAPEVTPPASLACTKHAVAEFRVNTRDGELAWHAAVAAAASLCIATAGIIEDEDCREINARSAVSWARGILAADDDMAKQALSFPHPEDEIASEICATKPWWRFW
jgi:hypothetical protein